MTQFYADANFRLVKSFHRKTSCEMLEKFVTVRPSRQRTDKQKRQEVRSGAWMLHFLAGGKHRIRRRGVRSRLRPHLHLIPCAQDDPAAAEPSEAAENEPTAVVDTECHSRSARAPCIAILFHESACANCPSHLRDVSVATYVLKLSISVFFIFTFVRFNCRC